MNKPKQRYFLPNPTKHQSKSILILNILSFQDKTLLNPTSWKKRLETL